MAEKNWLYCGIDWSDLINVIKATDNPAERLQEFNDILERDGLSIDDVVDTWVVFAEEDILPATEEWIVEDNENMCSEEPFIYWFFNLYTGEAVHVKYQIEIHCSGLVVD